MNLIGPSDDNRAQVVLVAATVVAIALLTMVFAYAQLSSITFDIADDTASRINTGGTVANPDSSVIALSAVHNQLTASVQTAVFDDVKQSEWSERQHVIKHARAIITEDLHRIESYHIKQGRSLTLNFATVSADEWARMRCPSGPDRVFGRCQSTNGVIVQSRAGETTIVAVAIEVQVLSPTETTNAIFIITVEEKNKTKR